MVLAISMIYANKLLKITILIVFFEINSTSCKVSTGVLRTVENWAFLTKFCFLSDHGSFSFDIEYELDFVVENLLIYYDSDDQWSSAYQSNQNCSTRDGMLNGRNDQVIVLNESSGSDQCEVVQNDGVIVSRRCTGNRHFNSSNPRWWFIAVSNCNSRKGLSLKYSITMTNGQSYWYKHFSADQFFILRMYLAAVAVEIALLFPSIIACAQLSNRQMLHKIYRLYMTALMVQIIGLTFVVTHYSCYARDGLGVTDCKFIGDILLSMSAMVTVLFILLMGQISKITLSIFMCFFCVMNVSLIFYQQHYFDPGEVLNIHGSPIEYCMLATRCVGWIIFFKVCCSSLNNNSEKASFYYPVIIIYTFWFLSSPLIITVTYNFVDKFYKEKVVTGVELGITIYGHALFLILTCLNLTNKDLEKNVRPSQVNALERTGNSENPSFTETSLNSAGKMRPNYERPPQVETSGGDCRSGKKYERALTAFNPYQFASDSFNPKSNANSDLFLVSRNQQLFTAQSNGTAMSVFQHTRTSQLAIMDNNTLNGNKLRSSLRMFNPYLQQQSINY